MAIFRYPPSAGGSGGNALVQYILDGATQTVTKDTVTPANSRPLPVELMGTSGPINITAGDLNVQLSDQGANPDVTRIGDGTNQLGITVSNEAKVFDTTVNTSITSMSAKLPATLGAKTIANAMAVSIASDQVVSVSATSLPLPTGAATEVTLSALNGKVTTCNTDAVTISSPLPAGANNIGSVSLSGTSAMNIAQVKGATPSFANSLEIVESNGTSITDFNFGTVGAATKRVAAQIGNASGAASFGVGNSDAQTLRVTVDQTQIVDSFIQGFAPQTAVINTNILSTIANSTASTNCQQYRSISFQIVTGASTTVVALNFEGSNDNVNFVPCPMYDKASPQAVPVTTFNTAPSTSRFFEGPISFLYFRVRAVAAITAGTIQAFTMLRMSAYQPTSQTVTQQTGTNLAINNAFINGVAPLMGNGISGTGSMRVTIASDNTSNTNPFLIKQGGKARSSAPLYLDYSVTNVTNAAYVQILAATASAVTEVEIFESGGNPIYLATGAAASEVDQVIIFPGGNGRIPLQIATATRLAVKSVTANSSTVGFLAINLYA